MFGLTLEALFSFIKNLLVLGFVPFIWWLIFHRKKEKFFKFVGIVKPKLSKPVWAALIFIAVYVLYNMYGDTLLMPLIDERSLQVLAESESSTNNQFAGLGIAGVPAAIIIGLFANGFCEELLYRGFIQKRIQARVGATWAIVITAVLFGLMHNGLMLLAGMPVGIGYHIFVFLFTSIGACLLGYANEKLFNGSIWPSIVLHGIGNSIAYITAAFTVAA